MTVDDLDRAAEMVVRSAGSAVENEGYGVYFRERQETRVVLRTRTCAMWDLARAQLMADGDPEDTFCGAHQAFYQELAANISPSMVFRFTKVMARGDDCCEWVFEEL